jgi:flagellin-specific chaperone FliS
MAFEPFQNFFKRAAAHYGVNRELEAANICHNFRELIPEIFNPESFTEAEEHIQPASFKGSTLTINVATSAWAQEVMTRKHKIIKELNSKLDREAIKEIHTKLFSRQDS